MPEDEELLTIGRFARLSGLSAHTLRHYDDVGLLAPAVVDASSRYRRYRRDQVASAHRIAALRYVDLPIEEIRAVLADPEGETATRILSRHRDRLARQRELISVRLDDIDHMLTKGLPMPATLTGCRPAQIKIAVRDRAEALAFYGDAFDLRYEVTRRTEAEDHSSFIFSRYGEPDFFLIHLIDDPADADRPGSSTVGLLVDDLDARHAAALAAGGVEAVPPHAPEGMPRCSAVRDPSGNWVWLYQG